MKPLFRLFILALIPFLQVVWSAQAEAADCKYSLQGTHLLQCHAIKMLKTADNKAAWTYVEGKPNEEGILAHIYCTCDTKAAASNSFTCEAPRTHKLTFTLKTQNITQTCSQGPALCETPCLQLINQQN